jgi:putative ABC transport system permease protein
MYNNMIDMVLIILEQFLVHIPLLLGAYINISLMKVPDLSIESAYVSGAILSAQLIPHITGLHSVLQIIVLLCASLLGGACVGFTSSMLTQYARLPHLLSSIVTFGIFYGINQVIAGSYIALSAYANPLLLTIIPYHPEFVALLILGTIVVLLVYGLCNTQLGYALAVYGNNPHFFNNYGVSTRYIFVAGIVIGNALSGLSGYMFAQSNGFADITMGFGKVLLCITALVLGKTIMRTRKPIALAVPLLGGLTYFILQQLLLKVGFNLKYFTTVQALVVLIILVTLYRTQTTKHIDHLGV